MLKGLLNYFFTKRRLINAIHFVRVFERERREKAENANRRRNLESGSRARFTDFSYYYTNTEINRYLTELTLFYGDICHTETLGFSYEGRPIRALKIGSFDGTKPIVYFEATVHAREWIATMVALYMMQELVVNYHLHDELHTIDVIIVPVLNPDGYEYSHEFVRS